jgi:hypothetical protein
MASWLIITEFGLDDWIYWHLLLQSVVITVSYYKNSQSIFSRTLLPWLPRTRSILVLVLRPTSESESELVYDGRFTTNLFVLATSPLRLKTGNFFFQMNTYGYCPHVTSSLTRGWVPLLQLLLRTHQRKLSQVRVQRDSWPHFTVSDSRLPPTSRTRSPYLYPTGTGWPGYTPRHWVSFSSPPTTRRATVEVFDPASTRDIDFWFMTGLLM